MPRNSVAVVVIAVAIRGIVAEGHTCAARKKSAVACSCRRGPGLPGTAVRCISVPTVIRSRGCLEGCVEKASEVQVASAVCCQRRIKTWQTPCRVGVIPGLCLGLKLKHSCLHIPFFFLTRRQVRDSLQVCTALPSPPRATSSITDGGIRGQALSAVFLGLLFPE